MSRSFAAVTEDLSAARRSSGRVPCEGFGAGRVGLGRAAGTGDRRAGSDHVVDD